VTARAPTESGSRIAVIGTGVAGMAAAWMLARRHEVVVYEAESRYGGHVHTHDVVDPRGPLAVDTGFIVCNDRTYPNLMALFGLLGVATRDSSMSFSVRCDTTDFEYNGTSLNTLVAQRTNLLRPKFWGMVRDILRFNREAPEVLEHPAPGPTLGEYLSSRGYGSWFVDRYLVPMSAAIWSAEPAGIMKFPARFMVRFFHNHGMLSVDDRPMWKTVVGGSRAYARKLMAPLEGRVRLASPVVGIVRHTDGVDVRTANGAERFDGVVVATHTDTALGLLTDPSPDERKILSAIPYQENEAVLHTDRRLLPRRPLARAAWNYHITEKPSSRVAVTYWMNRLQGLEATDDWCVTLNRTEAVDPSKIVRRVTYHHPVFSMRGVDAQERHHTIQGVRRTWFCGAWMRWGFHEDGLWSALQVTRDFGLGLAP